jgi:hypothetical protein
MDRAEFNEMMGIGEPKEKPKRGRKPKDGNADTYDTEGTVDGGDTGDIKEAVKVDTGKAGK